MDNYYLDQNTKKPVKIGSKAYIKSLKTKLKSNYETKIIMANIGYESYLKIKNNLPLIHANQFYCHQNDTVIIKNKSIKISDFTKHLEHVLPNIIDQVLDVMKDTDISTIRESIKNIFHNSLLH